MSSINLIDYVITVLIRYVGDMPAYLTRQEFENILIGYEPNLKIATPIATLLLEELEKRVIIKLRHRGDQIFLTMTEDFVMKHTSGVLQEVRLSQLRKLS